MIRSATQADWPAVRALQRATLYTELPVGERAAGFLSVAWDEHRFAELLRAEAIVVADCAQELAGYFACLGLAADQRAVAYLAEPAARATFAGRPLNRWRVAMGPQVCVAMAARGRRIATHLYLAMAARLVDRFDLMLGSVHRENEGGAAFNIDALGAEVVASDAARRYIAYDLRPEAVARVRARLGPAR